MPEEHGLLQFGSSPGASEDASAEVAGSPPRDVGSGLEEPFLMPVESAKPWMYGEVELTGRVERGQLRVGEWVELVGLRRPTRPISAVVTSVDGFRRARAHVQRGDHALLLLQHLDGGPVAPGMVCAWPGTMAAYTRMTALIGVLLEEDGGRPLPHFSGYGQQFSFRAAWVSGRLAFASGVGLVLPGRETEAEVRLHLPVAVEAGLRFSIRDAGRVVGHGVVTRPLT